MSKHQLGVVLDLGNDDKQALAVATAIHSIKRVPQDTPVMGIISNIDVFLLPLLDKFHPELLANARQVILTNARLSVDEIYAAYGESIEASVE